MILHPLTNQVLGRVLINFDYVRFAPIATTFVLAQQMTRWATSGLMRRDKRR
jgi:hypothetical protein